MRVGQWRRAAMMGACVTACAIFGGGVGMTLGDAGAMGPPPPPEAVSPAVLAQQQAEANKHAGQLLAARLVNNAYARGRDASLSTQRIAQEATILLQTALKLEPGNVHTLKLLVEAAKNSGGDGNVDVQREALRQIIRLDPGDLVSQVSYLDLLASGSQVLQDRAKVYRKALDSTSLDPQIRSMMAVRLALLATERADVDGARALLKEALSLNDVNVEALKELARLSDRAPAAQLQAIVALLSVNPYEPAAWMQAAGVLASAGVHDMAADALVVGLEQEYLAGQQASGELYLRLALEYAAAGRSGEAYPILTSLAKLPDAPMSAMMASELLAAEYQAVTRTPGGSVPATIPATAPGGGAGGGAGAEGEAPASAPVAAEDLPTRILKRLKAAIEADPKSTEALVEGIWVELSAMPVVAPETADWLKRYQGMAPADDAALVRLTGWQLLREKKYEQAEAVLAKVSAGDPLAQLGLARALLEQKKAAEGTKQLQDLWASHPTGLLAFQVAQAARLGRVKLAGTMMGQEAAGIWRTLPGWASTAHREVRDQELVSVEVPPKDYALGDPILVKVRLTNASDRALPVGEDGVIKTTLGLTAQTRGLDSKFMGMYTVENLQRVYRLEKRGSIEATVRADVALLGDLFQMAPTQTFTMGLGVITAPRGSTQSPLPGLGGQQVNLADFDRDGTPLQTQGLTKLVRDAAGLPLDQQMLRSEMMGALLTAIPGDPGGEPRNAQEAADRDAMKALRAGVMRTLEEFARSPSGVMRAWMVQVVPATGASEVLQASVDGMGSDADPVVRMMWAVRQMMLSHKAEVRATMLERIEKKIGQEKDPVVKEWMGMLLGDERAGDARGKGK